MSDPKDPRPSAATHVHHDRLRDGVRVKVTSGPNAAREGVVYDSVQGEAKVQLDGDHAGAWYPNEILETLGEWTDDHSLAQRWLNEAFGFGIAASEHVQSLYDLIDQVRTDERAKVARTQEATPEPKSDLERVARKWVDGLLMPSRSRDDLLLMIPSLVKLLAEVDQNAGKREVAIERIKQERRTDKATPAATFDEGFAIGIGEDHDHALEMLALRDVEKAALAYVPYPAKTFDERHAPLREALILALAKVLKIRKTVVRPPGPPNPPSDDGGWNDATRAGYARQFPDANLEVNNALAKSEGEVTPEVMGVPAGSSRPRKSWGSPPGHRVDYPPPAECRVKLGARGTCLRGTERCIAVHTAEPGESHDVERARAWLEAGGMGTPGHAGKVDAKAKQIGSLLTMVRNEERRTERLYYPSPAKISTEEAAYWVKRVEEVKAECEVIYSAEIYRRVAFRVGDACPFCGWTKAECNCRRPPVPARSELRLNDHDNNVSAVSGSDSAAQKPTTGGKAQ